MSVFRSTVVCTTIAYSMLSTVVSECPAGGGFEAENVAFLSQVTLGQLGAQDAYDCWGYTSESGREYAIIGLSTGTGFIEITDPKNPVIVDVVTTTNIGLDMKVYQDHVYSSSGNGPLHVIDLSDIDNGNVTEVHTLPQGATHNVWINEESGFLYLAIGGPMDVYDLSNPALPVYVGTWPGQTHDAHVVSYTEGRYAGREIAFVPSGWDQALDIVDVTDKSNMFLVGSTTYPNAVYTHQSSLSEDRQYLYLNDEVDDIQRTGIFDVSDLSEPTYIEDITFGGNCTDHNLYVRDGFMFQANYTCGLRVYDVCDPATPVDVGFFDTNGAAWSNYPFFPSKTVILSDTSGGLWVLDTSEAVGNGCAGEPCDADLDGDGNVGTGDLIVLLGAWGKNPGHPADFDGDGTVGTPDLIVMLGAWGPCPR